LQRLCAVLRLRQGLRTGLLPREILLCGSGLLRGCCPELLCGGRLRLCRWVWRWLRRLLPEEVLPQAPLLRWPVRWLARRDLWLRLQVVLQVELQWLCR
jgi:hypothetical protein